MLEADCFGVISGEIYLFSDFSSDFAIREKGNSGFADSTSKLGSFVRISSIAIDISSSMEAIEPPEHEHFSIRGFVAGMRKKDWTTCFPFASQGKDIDPVNYLPPLFVPEFRWWQCSSCIPNVEMKRTTKEVATKTDPNTSSCENVGAKDGLSILRTDNTVEEPDNTSLGSDGTFSVLPHRRKPKLRSLADILVEKRNQTSSIPRTRSASSCGVQIASTEMKAVLVPQLQADIPAGVAEAAQCPGRKRKIVLEEDREPLAATFPRAFAKRTKGPVLDAEKNSRLVEITDTVTKVVDSMRLDFPRTQQLQPKKVKAIDANKKIRHFRREDEMAQMGEYTQPNNASSANLQEQVVPVETNLGGAPSMAKTPEVGTDGDPLLPPRKSIFGNCNIGGTMAFSLSLNSSMDAVGSHDDHASLRKHRFIPDLNVEFPEKDAMEEEQQSTILYEERRLAMQKTLDAPASCSYETVRQGKRISEPRNKDNNAELGPSDDIPIEIVELLARNQHERKLEYSRRHLLGINDTTKGYSSAVAVDGTSGFPLPSRINGLKVANENMGVQPNKYWMDMSKPEKSHFRISSSSTPSQLRKPEYPTSASIMAGPKSITWEDKLYSRATDNVPFRLSNPPIQPSRHSFLDDCHRGRTVDGKGKTAVPDVAEHKEGRFIGSLDPYQNDTIPAMQLLSLMDQRGKSGPSYKVGPVNKPSSSCKNLPRLNGKENHSFLRGSYFPQNGSSLLRYGVYSSGESSFRSSPDLRVPQEVRNSKTTLWDGLDELKRRTARSNEAFGECTLNRNPADFSFPQVGNEFTISAKDLRPRKKRNGLKEKSRLGNVDGRKRQRMARRKNGLEC
ncbi:uncharacterized protein LOC121778559 isoform X2 [Salvia splendens]|uniref:uncharacterized protein LOC121778559 isoform X2 n=1 Tax=Salvia splendens TaxID=180675 RepID=UPI001C270892|nr:uncharacterized protein LOC121778559 isoform X2 [Salvia splendens]